MIKKDVVVAVLATFCLAIVLVTSVPVGSTGTYNPWLDSPSEDGKIDARDVAPVAAAYGSTGDPTKNVNVTNWPATQNVSYDPPYKVIYLGMYHMSSIDNYVTTDWCYTGGYSRMSLRVHVSRCVIPEPFLAYVRLYLSETAFYPSGVCMAGDGDYSAGPVLGVCYTSGPAEPPAHSLTETKGPYYRAMLYLECQAPYPQYYSEAWIQVYLYLRNE